MNESLEVKSLKFDLNETFYELIKSRDNLQIININRSYETSLYFFDTAERSCEHFLLCVVMDGEIELFYKDRNEHLKRNAYFYYEKLEDLIRIEIHKYVNLLVITSMRFFDDINDGFRVFFKMIESIGEKDHYTKGHCERVKILAKKIGVKLNFSNHRLFHLTYGAQFHDIGKIKVSDAVLKKQGKLNEMEFEEMKRHVKYSAELFRDHFTFLNNAFDPVFIQDIISQHHERLNGSGYPEGLTAEAILPEAKILAVCDSFDAMVTNRPYKKSKSRETAVAELRELSGKLYDPVVVDALESILEENYEKIYGDHFPL
ncbi:MAG TPA: HD-GYP domain-containing protein [Thermotogota bacterium]|nr:HD-GYP domain-containing protein [Thermotogota bacterium]